MMIAACADPAVDTASGDTAQGDGAYHVEWTTDPEVPEAGDHAEMVATVIGPDGAPVDDLQLFHGAFLHTFLIPKDLSSFGHVHQEDEEEVTTDDLRSATYTFHIEFETAGEHLLDFDFAHQEQYLAVVDEISAVGEPAQAPAPIEDDTTVRTDRDVTATLTWDVAPTALQESAWQIHLVDEAGEEITDIVQWGGADAHVEMVDWGATSFYHTHAWYPDMDQVTPSHEMPHLYTGPDIPFHYVFPAAGRYRSWVQFARESAPDEEYTMAFDILVEG